jgi:hypothetical protein
MEDEKSYVGTLLPIEDALKKLYDPEDYVAWFTYNTWLRTCYELDPPKEEEEEDGGGDENGALVDGGDKAGKEEGANGSRPAEDMV